MMLARKVHRYLGRLEASEDIDRLVQTAAQAQSKKADYFLFERRAIAEVKELVDERTNAIRRVLDPYERSGALRLSPNDESLSRALGDHPLRAEIVEKALRAARLAIERGFVVSNHQLRATRRAWSLPHAFGVLVLVNEASHFIDTPLILAVVRGLLEERRGDGERAYASIDAVLYFTKVQRVGGDASEPLDACFALGCVERNREEEWRALEDSLTRGWAVAAEPSDRSGTI